MQISHGKKIYFLSDFHLGAPDHASSLVREKRIVAFLDEIKSDASHIFILGDLFDFWYEYKKVVPKGFLKKFILRIILHFMFRTDTEKAMV